MADKDRAKWDSKYSNKLGNTEPSAILKKYLNLAPTGRALDIACGKGRNSLHLAKNGFVVDAVDISSVATEHLAGSHPNIHVLCQDIDDWTIPKNRYALIVNIRFLDRRLFPMIPDALQPGGVVVFESFTGGSSDEYTLKQNELLETFGALHIVYYEEKSSDHSERFAKTVGLVAINE